MNASTRRDANRKPDDAPRLPLEYAHHKSPVGQRWVQLPLGLVPIDEVFGTAHNIKLRSDRSPVGQWRDVWPRLDDVAAHVEQGGLFGSVPNTFDLTDGLHLSALDVDRGAHSELEAAYPALVSIPSWQRGRMHCYYPDKVARPNSIWSFGDVGGEVRSANGYLAHYRTGPLELATAISRWPHGSRCVPFPANLVRSPRTGQERLALACPIGCPVGLTPLAKLRGVAIGHRHPALVQEASRWAGRQTWNGRALDDDWLLRHLWRLALGMDDRLPDDEVAGIVGWAVSMRSIFKAMPHSAEWLRKQARRGRKGGKARRVGTASRDAEIVGAVERGESLRAVAMAYGLTHEGVRYIVGRGVK